MHAVLERLVQHVLDHRALWVALLLGVTVVALAILPRAVLSSSLESMFFGEDHPGYTTYKERIAEFGSDGIFLFAFTAEHPLDEQTLDRLELFHELAESRDIVRDVTSVLDLERVGLIGETIGVRRFSELVRENPENREELLAEIRGDPIAGGLLVSPDHPDVLALVELEPDPNADTIPAKRDALLEDVVAAGFDLDEVRVGGLTAVLAEMIAASRRNLVQLFPLAGLFLLLAVYLMFGRAWPVLVTTSSALIAIAWTAAFSIAREPGVNILMSVLPMFVMIISFSDVVHMCSAYLLNLEAGSEKRDAIVGATAEVGAACALTSVTTATGFIALAWVPAPAFQHLGIASAFGVICAYVIALIVVPLLLSVLPAPSDFRSGRMGAVQRGLDWLFDQLHHLTSTHPWPIIVAFAVVVAGLSYGTLQIEFETNFAERLDASNPMRLDQTYIEDRFIESTIVDVYVEVDGGSLLEAETFAEVVAFEKELESWDEVAKAVSFVDLMRATHRSIVGDQDGEGAEFGSFTDEALAQMMVLLEMPGPDALRSMIDFERKTTRFTLYVKESGIVSQYELKQRIEQLATEQFGGGVSVHATGIGPLMGGWLDDLLAGQVRGLIFSLVVIMLLLIVGFRSLRAGVVSMIPNLIPLLAAGAYCGLLWDQVDSDTLIVGMVAIGIGVDDTVHFISRYLLESTRRDQAEALRETFRFSGRGIFITTCVFVVGFLPALISDYYSIWVMGLLLPLCFVVALVADLLLVPALIRVGWIR